ncbi:MAG: glycosyltransferase family 2 protein [Solirubrobacterales bacterium]
MSAAGSHPGRPSIAVVLPTYNRRDRLPDVIDPLLAETDLDELIVVVDGCADGSIELVEGYAGRDSRVVPHLIENRGLARARLAGAERASADIVLTTDDDVVAAPGLVGGHARHHVDGRRLIVIGYMPVAPRPMRPGEFPRGLYAREYERTTRRWEAAPETILETFWAGNFSIRREDYLALASAVEGIDLPYHEDREFGLCCREQGLEAEFDRSLRATHEYERSPEQFLRDARNSAAGLLAIEGRNETGAESSPASFPLAGLPAPARPLVRLAARHRTARSALLLGLRCCGFLHLWRLERFAGNLAWRTEQLRAVCELR